MSYIKDNIGKNEEITNHLTFHWIIWATPIIYLILFVSISKIFALPFTILGFLIALIKILDIIFTEQVITNRRCMKKTGIISINTEEMLLSKTETVELRISVIGRILGFGGIKITGTGNSYLVFNNINNPRSIKTKIEDLIDTK
jgi:uncharacterized membrane protein YdbT with pleckstrin-like domain